MRGTTVASKVSIVGKVALVTGAGSGIGAVIARSLASAGARVVGVDINEQGIASMADQLKATLGENRFLPIVADVASPECCEQAVDSATSAFGQVNILVNNAGVGVTFPRPRGHVGPMRFWEAVPERWIRTQAVNSNGPYLLARILAPPMIENGWGRIVNVTTGFPTMLNAGRSAYGPSKAALEASSLIWSKELEGTGVTVNVILPGGPTDTAIKGGLETGLAAPGRILLKPEIFTDPIRWLVSEESNGITGFRFSMKKWDTELAPAEAAMKCGAPIGWEAVA
jgi:NAD(P)-dependent dehydrogenase (short-subunit alcohol dehydrogenase family)